MFDYRECEFGKPDVILCQYAVDLTLRPSQITRSNIEVLRQAGFSDDQITIATQVISYFNYINRIAEGLGVDLEDWMTLSQTEWLERKANW